jgi:cysteine synthase
MLVTALEASPALRRFDDVRELIASPANPTPLVRLNRVLPDSAFQLYLKLEWFNPFGSIKDRTAL